MSKRKTTEEFLEQMKGVNNNIIIEGNYVNNNTPIKCICKVCGHQWNGYPTNLLRGIGCYKCGRVTSANKQKKSTSQFIKELAECNPTIKLIGDYNGALKEATFICQTCDYKWTTNSPTKLVANPNGRTGCPKCAGQERKTKESFIKEMQLKHGDKITVLEYKNTQVPAKLRCNKCGREWLSLASNCLYQSKGCIDCETKSKREKELHSLLLSKFNKVERQVKFEELTGVGGSLLSYDFLVETQNKKYLIEHQGVQHEKPIDFFGGEEQFKIQQEHDRRKREYAKDNDYILIEIWYHENLKERVEEIA